MMQKILKNEKGSISLFVLLSVLFFLVVVTSVGISFKNKERSIDSQFQKKRQAMRKMWEMKIQYITRSLIQIDEGNDKNDINKK